MPIMQGSTTKDGKRVGFFKFGKNGTKYYYTPGNKKAREMARSRAAKQGRAIKHSQNMRGV